MWIFNFSEAHVFLALIEALGSLFTGYKKPQVDPGGKWKAEASDQMTDDISTRQTCTRAVIDMCLGGYVRLLRENAYVYSIVSFCFLSIQRLLC